MNKLLNTNGDIIFRTEENLSLQDIVERAAQNNVDFSAFNLRNSGFNLNDYGLKIATVGTRTLGVVVLGTSGLIIQENLMKIISQI